MRAGANTQVDVLENTDLPSDIPPHLLPKAYAGSLCPCIHTRPYILACIHTGTHTHTHARTHTHTHTGAVCPDIHTHTCMLARTHTCCLCVRVCISCTFPYCEIHAHRHPYTHVHVDIIKTTPAICFCVQAAAQSCYKRCPARRFSFPKTIANQ